MCLAISDDDTSFQVAVELSDGDGVLFDATLENSAAGELTVKVTVDARDVINVDVRNNDQLMTAGQAGTLSRAMERLSQD